MCQDGVRGITVGVDASRNRSGGAVAHLTGILSNLDPEAFGIKKVHLWAHEALANALPNHPWLVKHIPSATKRSLFFQLAWQFYMLPREAKRLACDIVLNTDAGSICNFSPAVTISQDMLSFEKGEMKRYGVSKAWLRLFFLKYIQLSSLRHSVGAIFLTNYAAKVIQKFLRPNIPYKVVPHGIGREFYGIKEMVLSDDSKNVSIVYVSNAALYKHQWFVVRAISKLRKRGFSVSLTLIGGGSGKAKSLMDSAVQQHDPDGEYIKQLSFIKHSSLPKYLREADIFLFASSCENMPITLMEGMASGLPIASSNRGPMPEVLQDAGVYFDPENEQSIAVALEKLLTNAKLRAQLSSRAQVLASQYSWERCAKETWQYVVACYHQSRLGG